jgi:hypothetical protein
MDERSPTTLGHRGECFASPTPFGISEVHIVSWTTVLPEHKILFERQEVMPQNRLHLLEMPHPNKLDLANPDTRSMFQCYHLSELLKFTFGDDYMTRLGTGEVLNINKKDFETACNTFCRSLSANAVHIVRKCAELSGAPMTASCKKDIMKTEGAVTFCTELVACADLSLKQSDAGYTLDALEYVDFVNKYNPGAFMDLAFLKSDNSV